MRTNAIDAHVHVWPSEKTHAYDDGKTPPCPGSSDELIEIMNANGVRAALIVQPINLGFDHTYVATAIDAHPGRFIGMALANPTIGERGVEALRTLLTPRGKFRGVRFNPALWPSGRGMDDDVGMAMFRACAEATPPAVVGFMCFHGLKPQIPAIRALCEAEPTVPVLIDHFGFTKGVEDEAFEDLLALGRDFEQIHVKCSAHFRVRVATEDGSDSTERQLRRLIETFGRERIVWGSDYPFVTMEDGGYAGAVGLLESQLAADPELIDMIRGENFMRLFPGAVEA